MIKTKGGVEVTIVGGSAKSLTGKKPFIVQPVTMESLPSLTRLLTTSRSKAMYDPGSPFRMYLTKQELVFDSEIELSNALELA